MPLCWSEQFNWAGDRPRIARPLTDVFGNITQPHKKIASITNLCVPARMHPETKNCTRIQEMCTEHPSEQPWRADRETCKSILKTAYHAP